MEDEKSIHFNKRADKTYVSKRLTAFGPSGRRVRIASKVFDSTERFQYALEKDELLIRVTRGGRQEVVAKFFEDDRSISVLTFQRYKDTGEPYGQTNFSFTGPEINRVLEFIVNIKKVHLPDDGKINITDADLRKIILSGEQATRLVEDNPELFATIARNAVTTKDIVALGYRREQLKEYARLLSDPDTSERTWQAFFEANKWIFGYGLTYVFLSGLDGKPLEQVVRGYSIKDTGKRADAVLKTRGLIGSLCFVEIKRHTSALLKNTPYRSGVWQPSDELTGGVAQAQGTVHAAVKELGDRFVATHADGDPTGEVLYGIKPRSFLVVGSLAEFEAEHGTNEQKYRSFELYRRSVSDPEIVTFDELFHRAQFIVDHEE
jgi:antiviral defense system Shedu protein SduA